MIQLYALYQSQQQKHKDVKMKIVQPKKSSPTSNVKRFNSSWNSSSWKVFVFFFKKCDCVAQRRPLHDIPLEKTHSRVGKIFFRTKKKQEKKQKWKRQVLIKMVDCEFIEEPWLGLASFKAAVDSNPNGSKHVIFFLYFWVLLPSTLISIILSTVRSIFQL